MLKAARSSANWLDYTLFGAVCLAGVTLIVAPEGFLAHSPPCLFTLITGHECWGCGITRAVVSVLHGDFGRAWQLNPRVVVVLPLLFWECTILAWRVGNSLCKQIRLQIPNKPQISR